MNSYHNINLSTGEATPIRGYDYRNNYITVYFRNNSVCHYTVASCGEHHIVKMKSLALTQRGLHTYIRENSPLHEWKQEPIFEEAFSNA